jgi:hypothetical protein
MLKQPLRLRRDLSLARVGEIPPRIHVSTHLVDDRGRIILLFLRGNAFPFVKDHLVLRIRAFAFFGLRNRRDELRLSAKLFNLLRRLPVIVQLPVLPRALVGRIQDGVVEKRIGHFSVGSCARGRRSRPIANRRQHKCSPRRARHPFPRGRAKSFQHRFIAPITGCRCECGAVVRRKYSSKKSGSNEARLQ